MSCYTRHLREAIRTAGLADDPAGHREADRRIRAGLGLADAGCPEVWRRVKTLPAGEVRDLLLGPGPEGGSGRRDRPWGPPRWRRGCGSRG